MTTRLSARLKRLEADLANAAGPPARVVIYQPGDSIEELKRQHADAEQLYLLPHNNRDPVTNGSYPEA